MPVPFPNSVKFHSLDNYKDIFGDCESKFPKLATSRGFSVSAEEDEEEETLEVFQTNGYDVSIVPDLENGKMFVPTLHYHGHA